MNREAIAKKGEVETTRLKLENGSPVAVNENRVPRIEAL